MREYLTKKDLLSLKGYFDSILKYLRNNTGKFNDSEMLQLITDLLVRLVDRLNSPTEYLSIEKAADCFGIEEITINTAIHKGKIGYSKILGTKLIKVKELENYIESHFNYENIDFSEYSCRHNN